MNRLLEVLKARAAAQVAQYPQYAGHFDSYILVKTKREIKGKGGRSFTSGEFALAQPVTYRPDAGPYTSVDFRTVWSMSRAVDVSVRNSQLEVVN